MLYMHVHTNDAVISQSNSIANNKSLPSIMRRDHPWMRFVPLDSSARPVPSCEGICNRMVLYFHIITNMGFWFLVMTRQALLMSPKGRNASRDGLV